MKEYEAPIIENDGGEITPDSSAVLVLIGGIAVYLVVLNVDGTPKPCSKYIIMA